MRTEETPQDRSVVPSAGRGLPSKASSLIHRGLALITAERNRQEAEAYCGWGCASLLCGQQQLHKAVQYFTQAIQEDQDYALAYYGRALAYRHLGQWPEALHDFEHAFRLAPEYLEAYYNREGFAGDAFMTKTPQGEEEYLAPHLPSYLRLAFMEMRCTGGEEEYLDPDLPYPPPDGQWEQEIRDITVVMRYFPYNAELYYARALAYRHCGQWHEALQDFERAVELHPAYQPIEAYYNQGGLCEFASAFDLLEKYYDEGYSYAEQSQYPEVIQSFTCAIALNPHFAFAVDGDRPGDGRDRLLYYNRRQWAGVYYTRGVAYGHLGRWEEAQEDFSEAIRLTPEDAHRRPVKPNLHADMQFRHHAAAYYWRAIAHRYLGCWEQAYKDYQHATMLHTRSRDDVGNYLIYRDETAMIYYGRSLVYQDLRLWEQAHQNSREALRLDREIEDRVFVKKERSASLYYGQALAYCDVGLWEQAQQNFSEAIDLDYGYAPAYYWRAITHRYLGRWQQAYEDCQIAARLEYGLHYWVTDLPYMPLESNETFMPESPRRYQPLSEEDLDIVAREFKRLLAAEEEFRAQQQAELKRQQEQEAQPMTPREPQTERFLQVLRERAGFNQARADAALAAYRASRQAQEPPQKP